MIRFLIAVAVLFSTTGFAGGADGAGGDTSPNAHVAWFDKKGPIHYCLDVDPAFGISADDADKHFQAAVKVWSDYMGRKGTINHNLSYTNRECSTPDVTIYLGSEPAEVRAAKKQYLAPIAFAERISYDSRTGWGRGFIWVASSQSDLGEGIKASDWTKPLLLQTLLTHELGHVLGAGHFEGTIMDESIPRYLAEGALIGTSLPWKFHSQIDQRRELIAPSRAHSEWSGLMTEPWTGAGLVAESAKAILGRPANGTVKGELSLIPRVGRGLQHEGVLSLKDDSGKVEIKIQLAINQALFELSGGSHFEHVRTGGPQIGQWGERAFGRFSHGTATLPDGTVYPIEFEQNSAMAYTPVRIQVLVGRVKLPMFTTRFE